MRKRDGAFSRVAACALALALPIAASADDIRSGASNRGSACSCPELRRLPPPNVSNPAATFTLNELDEIATLNALHIGLTEVPDGANFVWRRSHGRLSGTVRPLFSFKNAKGEVCRHVVVTLRAGDRTRTVEGAACREPNGRWVLEG